MSISKSSLEYDILKRIVPLNHRPFTPGQGSESSGALRVTVMIELEISIRLRSRRKSRSASRARRTLSSGPVKATVVSCFRAIASFSRSSDVCAVWICSGVGASIRTSDGAVAVSPLNVFL